MRRLVLLTLLLSVARPALAQDRSTIWYYDSLPPSLSIADIERRLGMGFDGFFGHEEIECVDRSRSVPGAWLLVSATTEPYANLYVTLPDVMLLVAATDSALTFRVEQGRHERVTHPADSYRALAAPMNDPQYQALTRLAVEAKAWCEQEGPRRESERGIRYPLIRVEVFEPPEPSVPRPSRNLYTGQLVEYRPHMDLDSLAEHWPYLRTSEGHQSFYVLDSLLVRRGLPRPVFGGSPVVALNRDTPALPDSAHVEAFVLHRLTEAFKDRVPTDPEPWTQKVSIALWEPAGDDTLRVTGAVISTLGHQIILQIHREFLFVGNIVEDQWVMRGYIDRQFCYYLPGGC